MRSFAYFGLAVFLVFVFSVTPLHSAAIAFPNDFTLGLETPSSPDPSRIRTTRSAQSSSGHMLSKAPHPLTNYTIEAVLQTSTQTVSAKTTINYVNHASVSLDEVIFHLYPNAFDPEGYITIESVHYAGSNLSYSISGIDSTILNVSLVTTPGPGLLLPNANVTLELNYQIKVPNTPDRFGWYHTTSPELLVYNLGNWHPVVAVYDERGWHTAPYIFNFESFYAEVAAYDVHITTPENYVVAATGELQTVTTSSGTRTWHWSTGSVRDFTWVASPHYQISSILVNGVNVTSYHTADHSVGGQRTLYVANQSLNVFGSLFGPYPWLSLRIVETVLAVAGMEYPQLVMIGKGLYNNTSILSPLETVIAHEIGHQWIPFTIGTDSYTEPWIDEGFASYAELVFIEYVYGSVERQDHRRKKLDSYWVFVGVWGDDSINLSMDYWRTHTGYSDIVYDKASLVIDLLRNHLGDTAFYQAWQHVYNQAIHRNLRATDLQSLFEEAVGEPLNWFFDHWVFGSGVITLNIGNATANQVSEGWTIVFQLSQAQDTPIVLRVPIQVVTTEDVEMVWVWIDAVPVTNITLTTSDLPLWVNLDPEDLLIVQYDARTVYVGELPLGANVETCDVGGVRKDSFNSDEIVYVNGSGFLPSTTYDLYIVISRRWIDGITLSGRIQDTAETVSSDSSGDILPTVVWSPPLTTGKYDIVIDINRNGHYDEGIDALDDDDIDVTAGFFIRAGDTTQPTISILSPENKMYTVNDVSLTFSVSESTSWIGYSLDGQTNATITGNITLSDLSDGLHTLTVFANDSAGNMGPSEMVYFIIDTEAPDIQILSPENKTYATSSVSLNCSVNESTSWIAYSIDNQANVTITGNTTITGLSDGSHSLKAYAEDMAGNTGASETVYFRIETKEAEPFPTMIVAAIVIIVVVGAVVFVYFTKFKK